MPRARTTRKQTPTGLRSRIIGRGELPAGELKANPANWRRHPEAQVAALTGILEEVGWVQDVIVNKTTGNLVDGHARVEIAVARGEETVPVVYVELTEAEEALVLATLDPLGAMAQTDKAKLDELLGTARTNSEALAGMLGGKAKPGAGANGRMLPRAIVSYSIIFDDEEQQERWFSFLRGLKESHPGETIAARIDAFLRETCPE